jgi:hypothetical protein
MRLSTLALAVLALAACSKPATRPAALNSAARPAAIAPHDAAPVVPEPRLAQIFTPDILGANVAWLENNVTGPAFSTEGADRTYKVGACAVIVGVSAGKIANIGNYGPACRFKIAQYFAPGSDHPVPDLPTFGDIRQGLGGDYGADCLRVCSNNADPTVSLAYQGNRADNFNELLAEVPVRGDAVVDAWQHWSDKLALKYGGAYVATGGFRSGDSLQAVAARDFAPIEPSSIRVGQDLAPGH